MITMKKFSVFVLKKDDALLGYTGENLSRRFEIEVDDPGEWAYKLDVRNDAGVANIIDLTVDGNTLYADIERAALQISGRVTAQIRAIDGDKVKCSNTFWLFIGDSVEAVAHFESLPPSEFEQMEARMTAIKNEVEQMAADLKDVSADVEAAQAAARTAAEAAAQAEAAAAAVEQAVSDAAGAVREQVKDDANRAAQTAANDAAAQVTQNLGSYVTNAQNAAQDAAAAKSAAQTAQAAAEKAAEEAAGAAGGGVTSFNGRSGAVRPQKGDYNAEHITFSDGQTFQQKYDSGELKGAPGDPGTSVTVTKVTESTEDGGSNVVTFSDGKTLTIKNGSKGNPGDPGKTPVKGTDYWTPTDKAEIVEEVLAEVPANGGAVVEPAEDDIPRVFLTGTLPTTKDETSMGFRYISKTEDVFGFVEIKCQGNSSMSYPKKNFTVKMFADAELTEKQKVDFKGWGEQSKHVYKANWIDLTHARNVVSARLWADVVKSRANYAELPELLRTSPNQGAVDGFPVKVYSNGVYQGRYTLNIPKDKWAFNMDDSLDTHCVLCGENYVSGCFRAAANINGADWTDEIHETVPASIKTRWNEIISFVMNSTDEDFKANLGNYFDVESLLDYHLFGLMSCGLDAYGKNQIYATYDGQKWIASMYDMDSTWGLWWTGQSFVSTDYNRSEYQDFKDGSGNLLYIRLENLFYEELQARWAELRVGALSLENIISRFERFTDIAPAELVKEDYASTTANGAFTNIPSTSTNNIQQIRSFAVARHAWCDTYVADLTAIRCTGLSLSETSLVFTGAGNKTLTATVSPANCTEPVLWSVNDASVASVDGGVVTALADGSCVVTATCGSQTATCAVSVSGVSEVAVDYTLNPLADVTWTSGHRYSQTTGELEEKSGENYSTKFKLQNCVYKLTQTAGTYPALYIWDENGSFVGYAENNVTEFVANPNWTYALKVYNTSGFDPSLVSLMPVDKSESAKNTTQLVLDFSEMDFTDTSFGCEANLSDAFAGAGLDHTKINKTNGHFLFLNGHNARTVYNNAPVFQITNFSGSWLLGVHDSNSAYVKSSGITLIIN